MQYVNPTLKSDFERCASFKNIFLAGKEETI
jgi:hypothetical protein